MKNNFTLISTGSKKTKNEIISNMILESSFNSEGAIICFTNGRKVKNLTSDLLTKTLTKENTSKIKKLNGSNLSEVSSAIVHLCKKPIFIDDVKIQDVSNVIFQTIFVKREHDVELLIVDNFANKTVVDTKQLKEFSLKTGIRVIYVEKA